MMKKWDETTLWRLIRERSVESDAARLSLQNCMPTIETVLAKAGTGMPDFTLHDEDHAFRVAERMVELTHAEVLEKMETFELALLLLAAYLHDIGMSPNRETVQNHSKYIMTAEPDLLSIQEIEALQKWLDQDRGGIELPIPSGATTSEDIDLAEDLLAYYCRARHNDWSEEYIRETLAPQQPSLYPNWLDDLIVLCRSHHDGLAELRRDRFDARMAGVPPQVVNLRYLAALLRVSDVLEFDPERTPPVILSHRAIAPKSRVFWYKDREISFSVNPSDCSLLFSARTPDAHIHKAVLETATQVDDELQCCSRLQTEGAFKRGVLTSEDFRFHDWRWPARLTTDVREQEGRFVYIEGAFRPDTQRILSLLSGTELYGEPIVAVRELLQNAFDAVREQMAYERLGQDNPSDQTLAETL